MHAQAGWIRGGGGEGARDECWRSRKREVVGKKGLEVVGGGTLRRDGDEGKKNNSQFDSLIR